jgi:hypothetical protein
MPASESSLRITEAYRSRLFGIRSLLERRAESLWPTIDGLDDFTWTNKAAAATQNAQREAVALTGAYLTAFLSSEVGTRTRGPILDTRRYSGWSRDGRPLQDALRSPMIGVRFKLKEGATPEEALAYGLNRAKRMVSVDYDHAHRTALLDGLAADERFQGWQRAVTGTCGACAGDIAVEVSTNLPSIPLQVHPNCQCVTEPVVKPRSNDPNNLPNESTNEAFDAYKFTAHKEINQYLRGDIAPTGAAEDYLIRQIEGIDAVFARHTGQPTTVYRGIDRKVEEIFPNLEGQNLVGKVIDEPGFSSTGPRETAELVAGRGGGGDLWELTVSPEVKALQVHRSARGGLEEVLLERDVGYRITGVRQEGGRRVIEATVFR